MFIRGERHGVCLHNAMLLSPTSSFSCSTSDECSAIAYSSFLFQHFAGGFLLSLIRTNRRGVIHHVRILGKMGWERKGDNKLMSPANNHAVFYARCVAGGTCSITPLRENGTCSITPLQFAKHEEANRLLKDHWTVANATSCPPTNLSRYLHRHHRQNR